MDCERLARELRDGQISGQDLADMVQKGNLSKAERRKVTRMSRSNKFDELSERQKLRLAVKEKKALPKLTKLDRQLKYGKDLDDDREKESANFTICLGCRKRGHYVKDCPRYIMSSAPYCYEAPSVVSPTSSDRRGPPPKICFNCGTYEHTLKDCPQPRDPNGHLEYANCFICKQTGHISRDCPENANGLYPNGGCCHICWQKTHLVKDCPERTEEDKELARLRREQAEDAEKGIRVKGLTVEDIASSTSASLNQGGQDTKLTGDSDVYYLAEQAEQDKEDEDDSDGERAERKRKAKKLKKKADSLDKAERKAKKQKRDSI